MWLQHFPGGRAPIKLIIAFITDECRCWWSFLLTEPSKGFQRAKKSEGKNISLFLKLRVLWVRHKQRKVNCSFLSAADRERAFPSAHPAAMTSPCGWRQVAVTTCFLFTKDRAPEQTKPHNWFACLVFLTHLVVNLRAKKARKEGDTFPRAGKCHIPGLKPTKTTSKSIIRELLHKQQHLSYLSRAFGLMPVSHCGTPWWMFGPIKILARKIHL